MKPKKLKVPEGHSVHRIANEQHELVGQDLGVTSPQGRFSSEAAFLDGRRLTAVEAKGKHLIYGFDPTSSGPRCSSPVVSILDGRRIP